MLQNNLKAFILIIFISFATVNTYASNILILKHRKIYNPYSFKFIDSTKAVITMKLIMFRGEQKAPPIDKIFYVNKNYFLQPEVNPHFNRKVDKAGKVIHDTVFMQLDSYRLIDLNNKLAWRFNLITPPVVIAKNRISDTAKTDSNRFPIPFMGKLLKVYSPQELQKEKDTIINHHHCIIVNCNKEKIIEFNNQKIIAKHTRLIIDNDVEYFSLIMADKLWYKCFGGVVISMEQELDNGITIKLLFSYRKLSDNENTFMNMYINSANAYTQK